MPIEHQKLYIFVDETGQETRGKFFLVSIVICPAQHIEMCREHLLRIEHSSKKGKSRWAKTTPVQRETYIGALTAVLENFAPIYWRQYAEGTDYLARTAETIVAAIRHRDPTGQKDLVVAVDGSNWEELQVISRTLRAHGIQRRKLRGGRDESKPFLRLADAMSGYIRDVTENMRDARKTLGEIPLVVSRGLTSHRWPSNLN